MAAKKKAGKSVRLKGNSLKGDPAWEFTGIKVW